VNIAMLLDLVADAAGDRPIVALGDGMMTLDELRQRVRVRAAAIRAAGLPVVAMIDVTGPEFVETLFAAAWAGVTFAPLNYRLRAPELQRLLERIGPAVVVHGAAFGDLVSKASGPFHRPLPHPQIGDPPPDYPIDPDAVAVYLHTSGTTSDPKAVLLRHRQLFAYVAGTTELAAAAPDEAALVAVPPYHIAGVVGALTGTYAARRTVHLPDFDASVWLDLADRERITHAFVVPTMLARITERLEAEPHRAPASLRVLSYGGSAAPPGLVERALAVFLPQTGFVNAFGLTETSSTVTILGPEDHRSAIASADPAVRARLQSAGRPLPGVSIRLTAEGEVLIRGEQVSGEYRDQPDRVDNDGWFHSGDLGAIDSEGYLFLTGRVDDLIIRGGENISPLEIEQALLSHPSIREAAVVGLPDPEWGRRVFAAAVATDPPPGQDEIRSWVRDRLASFKVPEQVVFVPALPMTDTGKVKRREVVALLEKLRRSATELEVL
jgi:acyl-CoA synthetase (AMP-forming)/AMP-acid ligase II